MAYIWQTVEQAAVTLGISTRTIARRIAKGELESRLNSGRREVFICAPDFAGVETIEGELTGSDAPQYQAEYEQTVRHTVAASSGNGVDVETGTALILAEDRARRAEMAISVIQQSTAIVRDEVRVARAGARWAWGTVAVLSVGVMIAVGWTTASVARSQQQTEALRDKFTLTAERSEQLAKDQEHLRGELDRAKTAAARAEGQLQEIRIEAEQARAQLAAMREKGPTTRPTFGQRLAHVVLGND